MYKDFQKKVQALSSWHMLNIFPPRFCGKKDNLFAWLLDSAAVLTLTWSKSFRAFYICWTQLISPQMSWIQNAQMNCCTSCERRQVYTPSSCMGHNIVTYTVVWARLKSIQYIRTVNVINTNCLLSHDFCNQIFPFTALLLFSKQWSPYMFTLHSKPIWIVNWE